MSVFTILILTFPKESIDRRNTDSYRSETHTVVNSGLRGHTARGKNTHQTQTQIGLGVPHTQSEIRVWGGV